MKMVREFVRFMPSNRAFDFHAKCMLLPMAKNEEAQTDCQSECKLALLLYTLFYVESKRLLQESRILCNAGKWCATLLIP